MECSLCPLTKSHNFVEFAFHSSVQNPCVALHTHKSAFSPQFFAHLSSSQLAILANSNPHVRRLMKPAHIPPSRPRLRDRPSLSLPTSGLPPPALPSPGTGNFLVPAGLTVRSPAARLRPLASYDDRATAGEKAGLPSLRPSLPAGLAQPTCRNPAAGR